MSVRRILIEGWRFVPHSYSIINQFQILEMLKRPDLRIVHKDMPLFKPEWCPRAGMFDPVQEGMLRGLPTELAPGESVDATLRLVFPHDIRPSSAPRTCVLCTMPKGELAGGAALRDTYANSGVTILTPSNWSREDLIRCGADPGRVAVMPHGVDPELYKPLSEAHRSALRRTLGWEGHVFLNVGAMSSNKGLGLMLKAFAAVAGRVSSGRLVLKGLDTLYPSKHHLADQIRLLSPAESSVVRERLSYIGHDLSFRQMATLYQAADTYISPYHVEAFNMPVLEATACGLPVVCTRGGPTDDFTTPEFALHIDSRIHEFTLPGGDPARALMPDPDHLVSLMGRAIEDGGWAANARMAGPQYVAGGFTWKSVVDQLLGHLLSR